MAGDREITDKLDDDERQSLIKILFNLGGLVFGAVGSLSELRKARQESDRLSLVNAVLHLAALVTSAGLLFRSVRRGRKK
ncbi:hypothetical protein C1701_06520 [Actinoalloteichus sp. AHMU CJ021]|uniref:Uncharacterized protein n=1 Tax=Actinoalloteichus caeruleus DSM 43889 TaxID=1120930 RepID=A0ABT1JK21_ACTCY|nr:hypothetical protein [Actinoalloteichus caeruleus]AUS78087.1 hypothetical protein C1701_06520 [Actinoalloteichus sp. AHMU CJ021]MCP2332081.1 hypothetical protein [Actinoalloteichus caeruleus DSM 43889]